jgi:hypothetical protein
MYKYEGLDYTYDAYAKKQHVVHENVEHHKQNQYNPYMNNMGTVLGNYLNLQ